MCANSVWFVTSNTRRTAPGWTVLAAYGLPAVPLAMLSLPAHIYLPTFFVEHLGLSLAAVGLVFLLARLWDFVSDPIIGHLSDRMTTPWGRRRPWIALGTPLIMVAVYHLFMPAADITTGEIAIWLIVLATGWTMLILPLLAIGAELSGDYDQRSRIAGVREAFVVVGTLMAIALPAVYAFEGTAASPAALEAVGWLIIIALPLAVIVMFAMVPDPRSLGWQRAGWRSTATALARNRPLRRLILAWLLNGAANGLPATLFLLFVSHRLAAPDAAGMLLAIYFVSGIAAVPVWLALSRRWGKHRTWTVAMLWACAVFPFAAVLDAQAVWPFALICILTGASLGADLALPAAIQADVVDHDLAAGGTHRTGLIFALGSMVTKLSLALAVGISFPLLAWLGFSADGGNAPGALAGLAFLYCLLPVPLKLIACALMWRFPLGQAQQTALQAAIAQHANPHADEPTYQLSNRMTSDAHSPVR